MKTVIWAVVAVLLAIINFVVDLGTTTPGGAPSVMMSASVGYALAPAVLSALVMTQRKYRSWENFFKYAAIGGVLGLFGGLAHINPPPKP